MIYLILLLQMTDAVHKPIAGNIMELIKICDISGLCPDASFSLGVLPHKALKAHI